MNSPDLQWNYNLLLQGNFCFGGFAPEPPLGPACPQTLQRGYPPSALPHVEECTYFWGVNTSWGINIAESKDLWIRKIIRLHNQQSPTWRLISKTPPLLYMPDFEPSWTWQISHLHLHSWRPTETEQELSFSLVTPFVNMSAGFWLVCIFSIFNCPSSKADCMKWYLNCIFLVFEWKVEFFSRWIALSLS